MAQEQVKFRSYVELFEFLPKDEALLTDVLRQIAIAALDGNIPSLKEVSPF